jgi:hypothetical protein
VALTFDSNVNLPSLAVTLGVNTHNHAPSNLSSVSLIWITPSANIDYTGLTGGEERRLMFLGLRSAGSFSVTVLAENAGSSAVNRFADTIIMNAAGAGVICTAWIYLGARWRRWKF